jgi:hypothetical protein
MYGMASDYGRLHSPVLSPKEFYEHFRFAREQIVTNPSPRSRFENAGVVPDAQPVPHRRRRSAPHLPEGMFELGRIEFISAPAEPTTRSNPNVLKFVCAWD